MDNLARLVGSGSNKAEWWKKPFALKIWVKLVLLRGCRAGVQPSDTVDILPMGSTEERTTGIHKRSKDAASLSALHPPCKLSSEGHPLTTLGDITEIIEKCNKIWETGRNFPSKFLQQLHYELYCERKIQQQFLKWTHWHAQGHTKTLQKHADG